MCKRAPHVFFFCLFLIKPVNYSVYLFPPYFPWCLDHAYLNWRSQVQLFWNSKRHFQKETGVLEGQTLVTFNWILYKTKHSAKYNAFWWILRGCAWLAPLYITSFTLILKTRWNFFMAVAQPFGSRDNQAQPLFLLLTHIHNNSFSPAASQELLKYFSLLPARSVSGTSLYFYSKYNLKNKCIIF